MIGDFNEVLGGEDKFGGNQINLNRALEFKKCLDSCNFVDLGFVGPKYTWTNKRKISNLILERLDRLLILFGEFCTLRQFLPISLEPFLTITLF